MRTIEYMPVAELKPAKRNPKRHSVSELAAAVQRFGVIEAQVLDERTGRVISGNGRLELYAQAEEAELDPPEGVQVIDGRWHLPIVRGWRSRNNGEAEAALVAVNRLAERGGWNTGMLVEMLDELGATRAGLTGVGYQPDDLADLRRQLEEKPSLPPAPGPVGGTGVRSLVLDYPIADYDRLARGMQALRGKLNVGSNAELVAALVSADAAAVGINV
jgi:hypothetical protein